MGSHNLKIVEFYLNMNTIAMLRNTMDILKIQPQVDILKEVEERQTYLEAFMAFDKNNNGVISNKDLIHALRRVGLNPTEVEVNEIINKIDNGNRHINFTEFCQILVEKNTEVDLENEYKECFRVFSKDEEGCIPPDELKFVLQNLPMRIKLSEIEQMIETVDKNGDGKISYSEFRVMMGAIPLVIN